MTVFSFLLVQATAPLLPLKFVFLIIGVVVLIVGLIIFAYKSYIKSDEPTTDDLSALHIGTNAVVPPQPVSPSPATRKQAPIIQQAIQPPTQPVVQQSAKLSTPAPVENKVVAPPPVIMREAPAPPPIVLTEPPPLPPPVQVKQTTPLRQQDATSLLTEELPSNSPRTLASPRVFSQTTPRQETSAALPPVTQVTYAAPPPEPQPQTPPQPYVETNRLSEPAVFGSLTEVQNNQSRSNRFTLLILAVAVIVIFWVGFAKVPTIHDTVMSAYDKVTGHNPPPPPVVQTPKIEIETKVTLAGPVLYVDGKVRNISEATLDNLYVEVSVLHANGKLSETRLVPIFAGAAQSTPAAQSGKEPAQPKEDKSLPPSQSGHYRLEVPGATFHDAQLKRILREDGTEVMFQKK